jgi:hypothetical protein
MSNTVEQDKLIQILMKILQLEDKDREALIRIIQKNHPRKIVIAINNAYKVTRTGKAKPLLTLEEFEKLLEKTRF